MRYSYVCRFPSCPDSPHITFCSCSCVVCTIICISSVGNTSLLLLLESLITSWIVISVGANVLRSIEIVLDIPSSSMATVLGGIWTTLKGPIWGKLIYYKNLSPISLRQRSSLVANQCTRIIPRLTSLAQCKSSCRACLLNAFTLSFSLVGVLPHCS